MLQSRVGDEQDPLPAEGAGLLAEPGQAAALEDHFAKRWQVRRQQD
jgi:hypothetical protein